MFKDGESGCGIECFPLSTSGTGDVGTKGWTFPRATSVEPFGTCPAGIDRTVSSYKFSYAAPVL